MAKEHGGGIPVLPDDKEPYAHLLALDFRGEVNFRETGRPCFRGDEIGSRFGFLRREGTTLEVSQQNWLLLLVPTEGVEASRPVARNCVMMRFNLMNRARNAHRL